MSIVMLQLWRRQRVVGLLFQLILLVSHVSPERVVLEDHSRFDLSWEWLTRYELGSGSGWSRSSQTGEYLVCDLQETVTNSTNSWLISNFINLQGAISVTIDIEFTARKCNLQSLPYCREYFNLYAYQTGHQIVSGVNKGTILAGNFTLVRQINAYDPWSTGQQRKNNTVSVNFSVRSNGLYLGFQDVGGCLAFAKIQLSFRYCPAQISGGASYPRTASPSLGSARNVYGSCAVNSESLHNGSSMESQCLSNGTWSTRNKSMCLCKPGFQMSNQGCQECPQGTYKGNLSNSNCLACPDNSIANPSRQHCLCNSGFHRGPKENKEEKCTAAPSAPRNLFVPFHDQSVVVVAWLAPSNTGGRHDVVYDVSCFQCAIDIFAESGRCGHSRPCDQGLEYWPMKDNSPFTHVTIAGLQPKVSYKLRVASKNGVSALAGPNSSRYSEVAFSTGSAAGMLLNETYSDDTTVVLSWHPSGNSNDKTRHDRYEISCFVCKDGSKDAFNQCTETCSKDLKFWPGREGLTDNHVTISELDPSTWYMFVLHIWHSKIPLASVFVKTKKTDADTTDSSVLPNEQKMEWSKQFFTTPTITALTIAGTLFFCAVVILLLSIHLRRRWYRSALKDTKDDGSLPNSVKHTDNTVIMEEILQDFGHSLNGNGSGRH